MVTAYRLVLTVAVVLAACAGLLLSSCSGETESLVGTWTSAEQSETLDFAVDGRLFLTRAGGEVETLEWQADDSNLAIGVEGRGTETFGYSIDDGVLTLTHPGEQPAKYQRLDLGG